MERPPHMPILIPMSPDITDAPRYKSVIVQPVPLPPYRISEVDCERAVYIWELHENTFPLPIIPHKQVLNPKTEPERDCSKSMIDLVDTITSGEFFRGQDIDKPAQWQLFLKNKPKSATTTATATSSSDVELQLVLKCERIYIQANTCILAKVACEIIDGEGVALWRSGDVYDSEVMPFCQGTSHAISLGYKSDLQEKRRELIKDGILRFRLRLNIYKHKNICQQQERQNESDRTPAKRRKTENMMTSELSSMLPIVETLWSTRDKAGDITIVCGGHELKAHRCIVSARSEVFIKMLCGQMNTSEKSSLVIKVDDITPDIMTTFLEFLYLGYTTQFDWDNVDHICALVYAADKYLIAPLMTKCFETLIKSLDLENFAKISKVTFMYACDKQFKDEVRHFFESNQMSLNGVESYRKFAHEDFQDFYKLFFYVC